MLRRTLLTVLTALVGLVVTASPAAAHTVSGVGANNWRTTLRAITPQVPGLTVRVVESGSQLELRNTGPEVVVYGYESEPYLRVGPEGVFENTLSPATYLNCSRTGCPVPSGVDPQAPPQWKQLSSGTTVRWHDHRTHWMGGTPAFVTASPGRVHAGPDWTVTLKQDQTTILVTGKLTWVPGPSPLPWVLLALLLAALAVVVALVAGWGPPLAALVAVLTANDVYHAYGIAFSYAGGAGVHMARFFSGSFYSIIGWLLGLVAVWLLVRRRVDGLYAAAFAGISAALFTGLLDFGVLSHSVAPFSASMTVDRITVAVSLGLGVGVAAGSILALRRVPRAESDDDDELDVEPGAEPGPAVV